MRLAESLRRGVMETGAGGIINRFKIKRRRFTLFFEDVLANYIKECEEAGYGEEMREIGESWSLLTAKILFPASIKKLPIYVISRIANKVWTSVGIMERIETKKSGDNIILTTKRDTITRIIGKNSFATGCFTGILSIYTDSHVVPVRIFQSIDSSEYVFRITGKKIGIEGKDKDEYNRLNSIPRIEGTTLKDAIRKKIFHLKGNRIYFRGKSICNSENTLFHIIGNRNIMMEKVPEISYRYFSEIIDKKADRESKLQLLKTLLQVMGWGLVKISVRDGNSITIKISHLPCGLQRERENWDFLVKTILGFLWTIDREMKTRNAECGKKYIRVEYSF
jgi:uncharacterized Zn finger protein